MTEPTVPPAVAMTGTRPPAPALAAPASSAPGQTSRPQASAPSSTLRPSAIPVALNEAALDSPTFRATVVHFSDQLDAIERWLDSYVRVTTKLVHDVLSLEDSVSSYLSRLVPPVPGSGPTTAATGAGTAATAAGDSPVLDADHTLPALRRAADAARDWWGGFLAAVRRLEPLGVDPVRAFAQGELRAFREARKSLDAAQRSFDATLARYAAQSKTKEPSALREDAFAVFETRRAYLRASLDFCTLAPQVRAGLDRLLVRVCADVDREMRRGGRGGGDDDAWGRELERIRGWAREMEMAEGVFRRELQAARREIGESTLAACKPSRELEDYNVSTVPYLGSRGPMSVQRKGQVAVISEKQGWLFLRVLSGKPVRTTWVRRWYYCRDGVFGWLAQGPQGVLMGDEIGVLLCSARPAVQEERRFCFEIKTKTQTIMLQAETQAQLIEWLEVFEVAKKRAIEASMGRDHSALPGGTDPAFSVTPPSIPEFSAKLLDSLDESGGASDKKGELPVPGQDGVLGQRSSFDVPRRAITTHLGREEGESGRDHAARIMQKLDLHRKSALTSSADMAAAAGSTGASLPPSGAASPLVGLAPSLRVPNNLLDRDPGSLAPVTLARAPIPTNLSKTAVLFSANATATRGMSSAILANYWGSSSYPSIYCHAPGTPHSPKPDANDAFTATAVMPLTPTVDRRPSHTALHRKTVSMDGAASVSASDIVVKPREKEPSANFPLNYPPELMAQYAQFRLIFPMAPADDKPVLVFNAGWSSTPAAGHVDQGMAGSGRVFVTPDRMYFYGHQVGLVVAYSLSLDSIAELTAAPGRDCDFLYLHLNQKMQDVTLSRITLKLFLEDSSLLQSRLNLLVDDLQAAEPMELSEMISALTNLGKVRDDKRSPSVESWEEVSSNTPADDGTPFGRPAPRRPSHDVYGGRHRSSRGLAKKHLHHHKLQLPTHPVVYEPPDMGKSVAERHFEISAKSCFHVLFGDKSFIFPKLYFDRGAKEIAQGPWELQDHGRMRRQFRFKVDYADMLGRKKPGDVTDSQTIDVFSDHITYVVTHVKTPWHLPHSQAFKLVTKVVITHLAKSKCKLAIYTKADWSKAPAFAKNMVQRQALDDAANDAEELAEVATDQVRRLGPHSRTKRAIQVYGNVGQHNQVVVFSPDAGEKMAAAMASATAATTTTAVRPRTLTDMMLETGRSFAESVVTSVMMWAFAACKRLFAIVTAHRVILLLLAASAAYNVLVVSQAGATWWVERRSARYMSRLGVGPNLVMSKAIYLADLEEAATGTAVAGAIPRSSDSQCYKTFQSLVNSTMTSSTSDLDAPYDHLLQPSSSSSSSSSSFSSGASRATARRLRRMRQRLGGYRHDLLVAMRVVNGVEREMVQAEWEAWLEGEAWRCEQVKELLSDEGEGKKGRRMDSNGDGGDGGDGDDGAGVMGEGEGEREGEGVRGDQKVMAGGDDGGRNDGNEAGDAARKKALREWFAEYCGSCDADRRALATRRASMV